MEKDNRYKILKEYVDQIGAELKNIRKNLGKTAQQVADEARLHVSTVNKIEKGATIPDYFSILKLQIALLGIFEEEEAGFRNKIVLCEIAAASESQLRFYKEIVDNTLKLKESISK